MSLSPQTFETPVTVTRTVTFSAAHRYALEAESLVENQRIYGSLYREEGFGHNFLVEAHFSGPLDPLTGMIANLVLIDRWLKETALIYDHQFLNRLSDFKDRAPTLELIAQAFFKRVQRLITTAQNTNATELRLDKSAPRLVQVRVYEGRETWVDYFG